MRHIYSIVLALLLAVNVFAQNDSKSQLILENVSKKINKSTIQADFIFSIKNSQMELNQKNKGTILMKNKRYFIEIPNAGIKIYSDGQSTWNYMANGNQVIISSVNDQNNDLMNPSTLFTIYNNNDYQSKYIGKKSKKGVQYEQIELLPKDDDSDFSKIELLVNKKQSMLHLVKLHAKDNSLYQIEIEKMNTNSTISDNKLAFDASQYPDVEIVDLR